MTPALVVGVSAFFVMPRSSLSIELLVTRVSLLLVLLAVVTWLDRDHFGSSIPMMGRSRGRVLVRLGVKSWPNQQVCTA
jgi:hypothetical protein